MVSMRILAVFLVLTGSILLTAAALCLMVQKWRGLWRFGLALLVINASFLLTGAVWDGNWWSPLFGWAGFFRGIAGNVALKAMGAAPVAAALLCLLGDPGKVYLKPGELSRKADPIPWLGIRGDVLPWSRLVVISGLFIMLGTAPLILPLAAVNSLLALLK